MPTFSSVALDNLLEPRVRDPLKKPLAPENAAPRHLYISPTLYATPEQAPVPEFSSPVSPSPYLANHKRRRGATQLPQVTTCVDEPEGFPFDEDVGDNALAEEDEGFLDPRIEAVSVESDVDATEIFRNQAESRSFVSAQGEFFDAIEEFSSDGSISSAPSYESRFESEWHASRLSLLSEIERRKTAERSLTLLQSQWEEIRNIMSEAGFTFPAPILALDNEQLENRLMDQMSQQVVVARFVAEAVRRGQARAEADEAASKIIELKDQEILRLRDKLQYYETVNHEMSQRKLVEVARRQQERKKKSRRRWIWSFVGLSVAVGASLAAYSYFPHYIQHLSFLKSGESSDASSISCPETSQEGS